MLEFFADLLVFLRGSDRRGTVILWLVAGVVIALAAAILGLLILLD